LGPFIKKTRGQKSRATVPLKKKQITVVIAEDKRENSCVVLTNKRTKKLGYFNSGTAEVAERRPLACYS
jgi:hypothetical protein